MSNIINAIKNLGKVSQKLSVSNQQSNHKIISSEMATQVILNNGLKMPRVGRKFLKKKLAFFFSIAQLF